MFVFAITALLALASDATALTIPRSNGKPRFITLEEHFVSNYTNVATLNAIAPYFKAFPSIQQKIYDLDQIRIADMDAGDIQLQVISHLPLVGGPSAIDSIAINNQLKGAIDKHPTRFAGFATLAMSDPVAATHELERCITQLKFLGALIDSHINDTYYEGPAYLPFWSKAQELDVPIYLHPTWASASMLPQFTGNFSLAATSGLSTNAWGWHEQTGTSFLRLFASGLFDKYPKLKIVLGHFGELLPYILERTSGLAAAWGPQRSLETVYAENVWITTSGDWSIAPLKTLLVNTPLDHIMYSVDYPFTSNVAGLNWTEALKASHAVSRQEFVAIAHGNAENLLDIPPRKHQQSGGH